MFTRDGKVDYIGFSYYGRILISKYFVISYEERGKKILDRLGLEYDDMWEIYPMGTYNLVIVPKILKTNNYYRKWNLHQ
ncbi:unnamed protein product [marine sediment metagenome]|uniref:Uncharacterized protein n=1 Tax=marine sediment metagenome TaxID=412755 RepID=X1DFT7_9ZZZZ|nr:hypothetical protein [Clostridia bacterium]